jgi:hypothetical protein
MMVVTCRGVGDNVFPRLDVEAAALMEARKKHSSGVGYSGTGDDPLSSNVHGGTDIPWSGS